MKIIDSADRIFTKIKTNGMAAVFIVNGSVKIVGGMAEGFNELTRQLSHRLLGVYDDTCAAKWIDEDLAWAENNMVAAK